MHIPRDTIYGRHGQFKCVTAISMLGKYVEENSSSVLTEVVVLAWKIACSVTSYIVISDTTCFPQMGLKSIFGHSLRNCHSKKGHKNAV